MSSSSVSEDSSSRTPAGEESVELQSSEAAEFLKAAELPELSLLAEFVLFLRENKAWWMAPILLALLLLALVAFLTSTAAAPFIYPLF